MNNFVEKIENKINCSLPNEYRNFLVNEEYKKYLNKLYNIKIYCEDYIFCYFLLNDNDEDSDLFLYNEYRFLNKDYLIFGSCLSDNEFAIYFKGPNKGKVYMTIDSKENMVLVSKSFNEFLDMLKVLKY